jgi:hypothetical protein
MSRVLTAVVLAAALAPSGAARAEAADCARLLPPPEVEKVTGLKPLELVDRTAVKFAKGSCNYATSAGKKEKALVLLLTVIRDTKPHELADLRNVAVNPRAAKGLPGGAFQAEGLVGFRQGTTIVSLGALVDARTGKRRVDDAKLLELARRVASRL